MWRRAGTVLQWKRSLNTKSLCTATSKPWSHELSVESFSRMREIVESPSPIGMEAAMTHGVLKGHFESFAPPTWGTHTFKGNAGIVFDTHPDPKTHANLFTIMFIGHADKIRLQVRSIEKDGKIYVNSDSFLPCTLLGHKVKLFCSGPRKDNFGTTKNLDVDDQKEGYRVIEGGTVEAIGAIHFASDAIRSGRSGITGDSLYLELQLHGKDRQKQVEELGIRPGDPILLDRPLTRGFAPHTITGPYLDNGLGCFVVEELARLVAAREGELKKVRCLFAAASHEEIGRFGSRVIASSLKPDALVAVDVSHDYASAPNLSSKRMPPLNMGEGFTITSGSSSIVSESLNSSIRHAAMELGIPYQYQASGKDTGTDAMAGFLAGVDCASASVGFPIRNMHTVSEAAHTGDVVASIHALNGMINLFEEQGYNPHTLKTMHPRLDQAVPTDHKDGRAATYQK